MICVNLKFNNFDSAGVKGTRQFIVGTKTLKILFNSYIEYLIFVALKILINYIRTY